GVSLTAQQPDNNIVRTAVEALAAVLGGTNSLHTNALDEVLALPSEKAAQIALRTQQVIADETGVANVADPLGGSWYVEQLTDELEAQAEAIFAKVRDMGTDGTMTCGILRGIEDGWFMGEIAEAAFALQSEYDSRERILVGVNEYVDAGDEEIPTLRIDPELERKQRDRLAAARARRDSVAVEGTLAALRAAAARPRANLMPALLDCARAHASEGEIVRALQDVFGTYTETPVF
ncbi:MAG: methylmalonyl-CoA mutase, partial [Actinobacteria bacterium]|nr:methylmalonyl-CoA mutase [Actinomycetota bacterium]